MVQHYLITPKICRVLNETTEFIPNCKWINCSLKKFEYAKTTRYNYLMQRVDSIQIGICYYPINRIKNFIKFETLANSGRTLTYSDLKAIHTIVSDYVDEHLIEHIASLLKNEGTKTLRPNTTTRTKNSRSNQAASYSYNLEHLIEFQELLTTLFDLGWTGSFVHRTLEDIMTCNKCASFSEKTHMAGPHEWSGTCKKFDVGRAPTSSKCDKNEPIDGS